MVAQRGRTSLNQRTSWLPWIYGFGFLGCEVVFSCFQLGVVRYFHFSFCIKLKLKDLHYPLPAHLYLSQKQFFYTKISQIKSIAGLQTLSCFRKLFPLSFCLYLFFHESQRMWHSRMFLLKGNSPSRISRIAIRLRGTSMIPLLYTQGAKLRVIAD